MVTGGFYKKNGDALLYAANAVLNKEYELRAQFHGEQAYPVDGWYWFESIEEAYGFFGMPMPGPEEDHEEILP